MISLFLTCITVSQKDFLWRYNCMPYYINHQHIVKNVSNVQFNICKLFWFSLHVTVRIQGSLGMGTPHWVSMFEDPRKYSDPSFVPDTCLSAIQESRCGEWVQGVRRVSKENLMSRPLPDIPKHSPLPSRHRNHSAVTSYDNKCYHEHPTEIQRSVSYIIP